MENTRNEKLEIIQGQLILTSQEIAEFMSEEETEMENTTDESKIAVIKERLEKYEEVILFLDEVGGKLAELGE